MNPTEEPKPIVVFSEKSFFETIKGKTILVTGVGTILFLILLISLNYYDVIFLPVTFLPQKLSISCPFLSQNCNKEDTKIVTFQDKPAAGYKLASNSAVINPVEIVDSRGFILPPFTKTDSIGLNQSFIFGNMCYTITYTVPYDSKIAQINKLPLDQNSEIITLGSGLIQINKQDLNLILQIQKRPLQNGETDQQKCPVYSVDPSDYGQYENINSLLKP